MALYINAHDTDPNFHQRGKVYRHFDLMEVGHFCDFMMDYGFVFCPERGLLDNGMPIAPPMDY